MYILKETQSQMIGPAGENVNVRPLREEGKILKGLKNVVNLLTKVKGSRNGSTDAEKRGPALGGQLKR